MAQGGWQVIPAAFLICALAAPVASIHDEGGYNESSFNRDTFLREYEWLIDLLKKSYPGNEFLIIPVRNEHTPPGWLWVPFGWRGHLIYRRPLKESA